MDKLTQPAVVSGFPTSKTACSSRSGLCEGDGGMCGLPRRAQGAALSGSLRPLLPLQAPLALELRPGGRSRGFNEKQNRKKQKETVGRSLSFSSRGMQGAWWQDDPP